MDAAFDRLTDIQKENINKQMFVDAYNIIAKSQGNQVFLQKIIDETTTDCSHLKADLVRYCRLVEKIK